MGRTAEERLSVRRQWVGPVFKEGVGGDNGFSLFGH